MRGDFVPANGIFPIGLAYDDQRGDVYVADWATDSVSVVSAASGSAVATIPVGLGPSGLVFDGATAEIFVANQYSNNVSVISDVTNSVVASIPVGSAPAGIAYDGARNEIAVANSGSNNVSLIDATSNELVKTVAVGAGPMAVAYDGATDQFFVANSESDTVSVVSGTTGAVITTVGVGQYPDGVAYDAQDGALFVADYASDDVTVISDINDTATGIVSVSPGPSAVAYDPVSDTVFVAAQDSNNVSLILGSDDLLLGNVTVGSAPDGLAYDGAQDSVFVANSGSNNLSEIFGRTDRVVASIALGDFPDAVAYDGATGTIFVASNDSDQVSAVSQRNFSVVATEPVGVAPSGLAYDSGRGEIFVANEVSNTVSVVFASTDKVVATIPVGIDPAALAYDRGMGEVFVANANNFSNTVSVISDTTDQVVATIPVGVSPDAIAYDSARNEIFVANNGSGTVSVIAAATNQLVATVTVGTNPDGVAYDSARGEVFVADETEDNVSVISDATNHLVSTIPVGFYPAGIVYDSGQGELFVANELSDNVSVISDTNDSVVATLPVGLTPVAVTYNSAEAEVIVTNLDSGTLSVLSDGSSVVYDALVSVQVTNSSGGPIPGASVLLGGQEGSTNASGDVQFLIPNGTYVVNASAPEYLSASTTIDVSGTDRTTLTLGYPYDFLGVLPSSDWSVAAVFAGVNVSIRSPFASSPADVFFDWKHVGILPVGSSGTGFIVDQVPGLVVVAATPDSPDYPDAYYFQPSGFSDGGCGAFPEGAGSSPPVSVSPDPPLYGQPTVITVGLHNSCTYTLHIDVLEVDVADFNAGGATYIPVGAARNITLLSGQYSNVSVVWNTKFDASDYGYHHCVRIQVDYGNPVPPQGNFISGLYNLDVEHSILAGKPGHVDFTVRNPAATSQVIEIVVATRLPSGWTYSVELNGAPDSSPEYNLTLGAGGTVSGLLTISPDRSTPGNGSVQIQEYYASNESLVGGLEKVLQELAPGHYPVDFIETGLGANQIWSVTLAGKTLSTNQTTIYANETNGSYSFTVSPVNGYQVAPSSGTITVNGQSVNESIAFTLPSGCYVFSPGSLGVSSGLSTPDFESDDSSATISFSGGITLTPSFTICVGPIGVFSTFPYIEPAYVNVTESLAESASATLTATGDVEYDNQYTFPGTTVFLPCIPVGPVPVCIDWSIVLGIDADLSLTGEITMNQGLTLQTSQNYSATTGAWTDTRVTPSCEAPHELLSDGCANVSASASAEGSLQVMIGPQINIDIADVAGVYLWPYVGLNVSAGASTGGGEPGACGGDSFGWDVPAPWLAVCGLVGIQGGVDLSIPDVVDFDLEGFDWTPFAAPLGASVAVCGSSSTTCDNSIYFTPNEAVTLQAEAPVTGLTFSWSGSCLPGPETGDTVTFVAPSTTGSCELSVTTGLPLSIASLDLSEIQLQIRVTPAETLTFTESGLPSGSAWSVTAGVEAKTETTSGKSLSFTEPQGLVSYSAKGPSGFSTSGTIPASATSPVNVTGATKVTIKFGHLEDLSFRQTGLLSGVAWKITLSSAVTGGPPTVSVTTRNASYGFIVVADPYKWTLSVTNPEFQPTHSHGTVGVVSSPKVVKVVFKMITSKVTFVEKGLPSHTHWTVAIYGGPVVNGTGGSIVVRLPNGTYSFVVTTANPRYTTNEQTGILTVTAPLAVKIAVKFADPPSSTQPREVTPGVVSFDGLALLLVGAASRTVDVLGRRH